MLPAADALATDRPGRVRRRASLVLVRPTYAACLRNAFSLKSDAAGARILLVAFHLGLTAAHARVAYGGVLAVNIRVDGGRGHWGKAVHIQGGGAHLVLVSLLLIVHGLLAIAVVVEGVRAGLFVVAVIVEGVTAVVVVGPMLVPMLILLVLMPTVGVVVASVALLPLALKLPPIGMLFLCELLQAIPFLLLFELEIWVTTIVVLVPCQAHVPGGSGRDRHEDAAMGCVCEQQERWLLVRLLK